MVGSNLVVNYVTIIVRCRPTIMDPVIMPIINDMRGKPRMPPLVAREWCAPYNNPEKERASELSDSTFKL